MDATTLAPNNDLTVEGEGLTVATGGVGLEGLGGGSRSISVTIGGPVQAARLYWIGRDRPCSLDGEGVCEVPFEPYLDQELVFDGVPITGDIVGTESQAPGQAIHNIGYAADVTAIVQAKGAGAQSFSIEDGDTASNLLRLNGAGLLVIYQDELDFTFYQIIVYDGLDFAFNRSDQNPPARVTEPVTFMYDEFGDDRTGELTIFAGDATPDRPDRVDISDNPSLVNELVGAAGESFDAPTVGVSIPAGTTSTTVQLFSEPEENFPDSLLWVLGVLRVPFFSEEAQGCRVTGGGVDTLFAEGSNGNQNGNVDRYQFGGQAGAPRALPPQPEGNWTHHQQRGPSGSFTFHAGTSSAPPGTEIDRIFCADPGWCVQARPAPDKQINFEGVGTFKNIKEAPAALAGVVPGETFHWFDVHIEDLGEPGKGGKQEPPADTCPPEGSEGAIANCECPDFYRIRIYMAFDPASEAPNRTDVVYEVGGYITGGNLQIHPLIDG